MVGTSLQLGRGNSDDRFYHAGKGRQNQHQHHRQSHRSPPRFRSTGVDGVSPSAAGPPPNEKVVVGVSYSGRLGAKEVGEPLKVATSSSSSFVSSSSASEAIHLCNLSRFLESTTPAVPAQYPSKTRIKGWRTSEIRPYFVLSDLWESFKEWSAYGAGVPLLLNRSDSVVQYYVPFLSGIQLYGESIESSLNYRRPGEDSDGEYYRDSSSSDGSSDYEHAWSSDHSAQISTLRMDNSSLREKHTHQEGSSSDDGESGNTQGHLLFEFLERDPPFIREPLADKILDLAKRFPALKTLRSCDLLPSSWISVAWYPIYRIPTGPTLKDLDACFLTFHCLSTMFKDAGNTPDCTITFPEGADGAAKVSLPTFGLASYKFKGSIWIPNGGSELQLANSLLQAADKWLMQLSVYHPDYRFFVSHGQFWR